MTVSQYEAAFDEIVAELDAVLVRLCERSVLDHPAFSIETDSYSSDGRCVTIERAGAASLRLMVEEPDWARVDINGLEECLAVPIAVNHFHVAGNGSPVQDTFMRLLTSRFTVTFGRLRTKAFMTDASGQVWCRNTYLGTKIPPQGQAANGPREFSAVCPTTNR